MQRFAKIGGILAVLSLMMVGSAQAQQADSHTITDQELRSAVGAEVESEAADRAVLQRVLSSEAVQSVGEDAGLDVERAQDGARLLEGQELARAASLARDVDNQLAGGQNTVTITTTTIIIVLLIIILIIVA